MSDPLFDTSDGNTPIDEDENALGLKLTWVRTAAATSMKPASRAGDVNL